MSAVFDSRSALETVSGPLGLARARPDLCRALVETVAALSDTEAFDERMADRFMLVGWMERRGSRLRLTNAGNLVYAIEARRLRIALKERARENESKAPRPSV